MIQDLRRLWPMVVVVLGCSPAANADTLYRWVDEQGRLHLSDQPPADDPQSADELAMPSYATPERPAEEDPYSILNQLKRLEESGRRLTRERWEKQQRERELYLRQRELEARERAQQPADRTSVYLYPRPRYALPPARRPGWHGHRPRPPSLWEPDHPAYRPYPPPRPISPHRPEGGGRIGLGR